MKKISACIFIVLAIGIYGVFDLYLSTTSEEFISNWVEAEATAIQQGDVITSISKGYRIFKKSQFVQGLGLFDKTTGEDLIPVGEQLKINKTQLEQANSDTQVKRSGFLTYTAYKEIEKQKGLVLVAKIYSVFFHLFYLFTVIIGMLLLLAFYSFVNVQKKLQYQSTLTVMKNLIHQLEHDAASPLQIISNLVDESKNIEVDKKSLIERSIKKIKRMFEDINSYQLNLENGEPAFKKELTKIEPELRVHTNLALTIKNVVKEKWEEYRGTGVGISKNLQLDSLTAYSPINSVVLNRILSNIINNAAEAKKSDKVSIEISLKQENDNAVILIKDNGIGISKEIRQKLGKRGATFGKENGKGLGLYYAKTELEELGGKLEIQSESNAGATVILTLPLSYNPQISLSELFTTSREIVVVDDDMAIHNAWSDILPHCSYIQQVSHIHTIERFMAQEQKEQKSFIVDYELERTSLIKGLDLITKFKLESKSVLSTFSSNNASLQKRCIRKGVAILPKELLEELSSRLVGFE